MPGSCQLSRYHSAMKIMDAFIRYGGQYEG